jgi:16S rRNA (cytosine1402-N4)-methyltransferase
METAYHIPVLLNESIDALVTDPNGVYVDLTFGGGGHSQEILNRLSDKGQLISFDKDINAHENQIKDKRLTLVGHNFRYAKHFLHYLKALPVDGILGDLGISSNQINTDERGFAHRLNGPLDMRMDVSNPITAEHILEHSSVQDLTRIFKEYGEIQKPYKLAQSIDQLKGHGHFSTVEKLKNAIESFIPKKDPSRFLSQVFQALRIAVNDELTDLKHILIDAAELIKTDGKLMIISYHSLEDRLVKNLINTGNIEGERITDLYGNPQKLFVATPRKPIVPSEQELIANPRSRSAKLRVGIKL